MTEEPADERAAGGSPSAPDDGNRTNHIGLIVEALLFAADAPISMDRLISLAGSDAQAVATSIRSLNDLYHATGRTFRISRVAQGFQLYTTPEYAGYVRNLYQHQFVQRLSKAALEVLAIIAYRQPITRPDVERLRSVDCSGPILTLLERRLIATAGRAHRPGNPFLYRTTREFLRYFGLETLSDLPRLEELGEFLASHQPGAEQESSTPGDSDLVGPASPSDLRTAE